MADTLTRIPITRIGPRATGQRCQTPQPFDDPTKLVPCGKPATRRVMAGCHCHNARMPGTRSHAARLWACDDCYQSMRGTGGRCTPCYLQRGHECPVTVAELTGRGHGSATFLLDWIEARYGYKLELRRLEITQAGAGPGPHPLPGVCAHPPRYLKSVIETGSDRLVAWLCTGCDAQLPADWAVAR